MNQLLLLAGVVIVACILMNRIAAKLPLPSLLLFIGLGMCFGVDGFFKIPFDDYELSEAICSVSLLFVMFYVLCTAYSFLCYLKIMLIHFDTDKVSV